MPRTTEEILKHADELARRFEEHEPDPEQIRDARSLRDVARAFEHRARAEADLTDAVSVARAEGHTWSAIGAMLGTSGEAARQRYGSAALRRQAGERQPRSAAIRGWAAREGHPVRDRESQSARDEERKRA
jgi:hypothetical protein